MRIGFVGTGGITQAVVTGLCASDFDPERIFVSPRNAETAARLARQDARVQVCRDNQHVVDESGVVCIAVLPSAAAEVLRALRFRADQKVISFVAGLSLADLKTLVAGTDSIVRAIPLPATAQRKGSTVFYPPDDTAAALFDALGTAVPCDEESHYDAFAAATATMASYYAFVEAQARWLTGRGVPYDRARTFLTGYHAGLAQLAEVETGSFAELSAHCTTKGGLNEMVHERLAAADVFGHLGRALDAVWDRAATKK
jgi:pyrroline-5-carboxylate reductase